MCKIELDKRFVMSWQLSIFNGQIYEQNRSELLNKLVFTSLWIQLKRRPPACSYGIRQRNNEWNNNNYSNWMQLSLCLEQAACADMVSNEANVVH